MLNKNDLVQLMKTAFKADSAAPVAYSYNGQNFSYDQLTETVRNELNELAGSYSLYRENKNTIFSIIEEVLDDVLPKKVTQAYEAFAEVKTFTQGDKPEFVRKKNSRLRAKQFITRAGLAGVYETFKLGNGVEKFEVPTSAMAGAGQIGLEEFLDGRANLGDILDVILEGFDETIYAEIGEALKAAVNQLPPANRVATNGFDETSFDKLINVASAYGEPTIYCTYEFAVKMIPQEAWRYSDAMKEELNNTGRLANYKGKKVIILPQGFTDETNSTKVVDPGYVWIIPTGSDNKPVKIAFEGQTIVDERKNEDWSRDVQVYKKVGVVAMMANNICSYVDTDLKGKMNEWFLSDNVKNTVTVVNA